MATESGPLFDGRAEQAAEEYTRHLEAVLAREITDRIHTRLGEVIKINRGVYESHIHTVLANGGHQVTDDPIVYGPWLEGTGSRNAPVTRFAGYHTFRKVTQAFKGEVPGIAEREIRHYVELMN